MKQKVLNVLKKLKTTFTSVFKKKKGFKNPFKNIKINKKKLPKIAIIAAIIIVIIVILNTLVFSRLERVKINEVNNKLANYLDEVVKNSEDEGKYVNYALEYLYNTSDDKKYSFDEVLEVINDTFAVDYTKKEIEKIGVTVDMANKGIVIDGNNHEYIYNYQKTRADIANTPIVKYYPKKVKRVSINKYKVTYDKYVVENPYEVLNYYEDLNLKKEKDRYDTTDIVEYLKGNRKIGVIKDAINEKNIEKIGKIDGSISVTFVVKNNKVLIKKIG